MESRIPASQRTSQKLNDLLSHGVVESDARSELIKLAVRKIVEEALEAEVADALGRGYYLAWPRSPIVAAGRFAKPIVCRHQSRR